MKARTIYKACVCILAVSLLTSMSACSYMMDAIEGAITDRSSFSIHAEYSVGNVYISWDETDSGEEFAGYEIYITEEPDDEYSGYDIVASRYFKNGSPSLKYSTTDHYSAAKPESGGLYFYRVGIIHWNEKNAAKRPWDWDSSESYYNGNTSIGKISGYAMVEIP